MTIKNLIENVTIIDGLGNEPFKGNVLIENNLISKIYKNDLNSTLPEEVELINGKDKYLLPGLIDGHCHSSFDEVSSNDELFYHRNRPGLAAIIASTNLNKILRSGVTSICDPDSIHELGYDLKDAVESNVIPGPRISTGGYALLTSVGGTAGRLIPDKGVIGYGKVVSGPDEIISEVRRQIKMGADWIKVHVSGLIPSHKKRGELSVWSKDELELVCKVAHDLGTPVMGHCRGAISVRDAALSGFDMILHGTLMDEEALDAVITKNVALVPTFTFQANLIDHGNSIGASEFIKDLFRREIEDSCQMLRKAYENGVKILCGSESGFSVTPYGHWHYREMEVLIKEMGFTELEAIKSATSDNAFTIQLEGKLGRVEEGCIADLILINKNPVKDISVLGNLKNIELVMKDGIIQKFYDQPERKPISGWRVTNLGEILTQDVAKNKLNN